MGVALKDSILPEGANLGRYRLHSVLGEGGMATVYLGRLQGHAGFRQWVAIKRMYPHLASDRRFVDMFLDEARIAGQVRHPNVCATLDFGEDDGIPFLVMEYLHGETLSTILQVTWEQGSCPLWLSMRAVADAARGLHAAHELRDQEGNLRNLVHRDVSPQNIMVLYDGITKIMDFGVAKAEGRMSQTTAGELKGKFGYMAPEQLDGAPLGRQSDVWALGVICWEATVGRSLFRRPSAAQTTLQVLNLAIPDPRDVIPGYPALLAETIMSALVRDPSRRTPTAREFADQLDQFLYSTGRPTGPEQVSRWLDEQFHEQRADRERIFTVASDPATPTLAMLSLPTGGRGLPTDDALTASGAVLGRRRWPKLLVVLLAIVAAAAAGLWASWDRPVAETNLAPGLPSRPAPPTAEVTAITGTTDPGDGPTQAAPEADAASAPETDPENPAEPEGPAEPADALDADGADQAEALDIAPKTRLTKAQRRRERRRLRAIKQRRLAQTRGRLNLLAIPPAEVYLGARLLGRTPLSGIVLPAGRYRLNLRPTTGGAPQTVTVTIQAGERTTRSVRFTRPEPQSERPPTE